MINDELLQLADQVGQALNSKHYMLAVAESCTGGELAAAITAIPGSSAWFERGFVTYSNAAKQELLGVPATTLTEHGAVSQATAYAMAKGALRHSHAQFSIAITGIAGPDGGTDEKPVGTVCLAWASTMGPVITTDQVFFTGNRLQIRYQATIHALQTLLEIITNLE